MIYYTGVDHAALLPALILAVFGCATFLLFPDQKDRKWMLLFVVAGLALSGGGLIQQQRHMQGPFTAFHGALTIDGLALFFNWIFLVASLIVVIVSHKYLETEREAHSEYYGLILLANCGMYFLATGTDLITLFVGLELMALCFYILVGFLRSDKRSNEAAMKYLLLGAFSSGFLVYGFSVLYGIAGSTRLGDIADAIAGRSATDPLVLLALGTTAVGLFFKISAVPFHMWAPDAYEGAPTTITAYLSVGSKAASFAFLLRMFLVPFSSLREVWTPLLIGVAIATMTVGNLAAISQTNIKRLLAYSSISHAGYMLLGLIAGNGTGIRGIAVYIMVYTFMNLGAFMVIVSLRRKEIIGDQIEDLNGLISKSPVHAVLMLIFLMSLAGIPPTAGFLGKYYIFLSLIETGHNVLAVIAVLYVAVAVYYYFRMVRAMFVSEAADKVPAESNFGLRVALAMTGAMTVLIGVYPEPFLRLTQMVR
jgi:NADH-quinone oxidoreductase subunit N